MEKVFNDTELAIINATKDLLTEKGNVTIKEIAEKAYVNIAAINYHFGSKDQLISVVIKEVIRNLQNEIVLELKNFNLVFEDFETSMTKLFDIIFTFAEKNAGIINYSFLQMANQSKATNILVELFIVDDEFIKMVTALLSRTLPNANQETLFAKYIILFSSFVVPFFLSFSGWSDLFSQDAKTNFFKDNRETYLEELKKIVFS